MRSASKPAVERDILPPKVMEAVRRVIDAHRDGLTGSLEIHFNDGHPTRSMLHQADKF